MNLKLEEFETMIKNTTGMPVKRALEVRSGPACADGENYCSYIYRIELDVVLESRETLTLLLVAKLQPPPEDEMMYNHVNDFELFTTELKMYETLFPANESLIKLKKFPSERLWPELMGTNSTGTVILLEDLKCKGYRTVDVGAQMDLDHALLVMKGLGRFHALNLAVGQGGKIDPTAFPKKWFWTNESMCNQFFTQPLLCLSRTMKESWGTDWLQEADRFHEAHSKILDRLKEMSSFSENRLNVINHGDTWTANVLFRYDSYGNPNSIKFIDYQMSVYNTFALDLTNFLYTSVKSKVRRASYNELMDAYRTGLVDALTHYGLDFKEKTSKESINKEMDRLKFFGFLMLISIQVFSVVTKRLSIGFEEMDRLAAGETVEAFEKVYVDSEVRDSIEDDLRDFLKCGFI